MKTFQNISVLSRCVKQMIEYLPGSTNIVLLAFILPNCIIPVDIQPVNAQESTVSPNISSGSDDHVAKNPLLIESDRKVERLNSSAVQVDLGNVDSLASTQIHCVFFLKNTTSRPITIAKPTASCGCTTAFIEKAVANNEKSNTNSPVAHSDMQTLAPGEQVTMRVAIDTGLLKAGGQKKTIWIHDSVQSKSMALATIQMDFNIEPLVEYSPPYLYFGRVPIGKERAIPLIVTFDRRLLPDGLVPSFLSSNPDIHIIKVEEDKSLTEAEVEGVSGDRGKEKSKVLSHRVKVSYVAQLLSSSRTGPVYGTVRCQPPIGVTGTKLSSLPEGLLTVHASGEILGSVNASPSVIAFGSITLGETAQRLVTLSSNSIKNIEPITVKSSTKYLSYRIIRPPAASRTSSLSVVQLEFTLNPKTPTGSLNADVMVTTSSGETIVIPVFANLSLQ